MISVQENCLIRECKTWLDISPVFGIGHLTRRLKEVLDLACSRPDLVNKEMASVLGVSTRTIKFHLRRLFDMYGVGSRRELIEKFRIGDQDEKLISDAVARNPGNGHGADRQRPVN